MIDVESKVMVYEYDGKRTTALEAQTLTVASHWNDRDLIEIDVDGHTYAVGGSDLIAAIANAQNTGRR